MAEAPASTGAISSRYLSDPSEVNRVFQVLRDQRSPMSLMFDGDDGKFTAQILEVRSDTFLLEDIRPRSGYQLARIGKDFRLAGRADGMYVYISDLVFKEVASERGLPYFIVKLPDRLLYQQRRKAARFQLPLRVTADGASVVLNRGDTPLTGYILDISAGGCRVAFDGIIAPPFEADEVVARCEIDIPNLLELSAEGTIRHHSYNKDNDKVSCGIEFTRMEVTDRRRLEHFVQKISHIAQRA